MRALLNREDGSVWKSDDNAWKWVGKNIINNVSFVHTLRRVSIKSFLISHPLSCVFHFIYVIFSFHSTFPMYPRVVHKNSNIYSIFLKWNKRCTLLSEMEWSEKGRKKEFGSLRLMFLLHLLHRLTYIGFDTNIMSCWRRQQQTTIWWWLETIRI
jgi:hypothetical protein